MLCKWHYDSASLLILRFDLFADSRLFACGISWAMSISLFYFASWLVLRGASFVRPSVLQRGFATVWLFSLGWALQVFAAVAEDRWNISSLYAAAFLESAAFVSIVISLLEMFALPGKKSFAHQLHDAHQAQDRSDHDGTNDAENDQSDDNDDEDEPTETTPLRAGDQDYGSAEQPTFANTYRQSTSAPSSTPHIKPRAQPYEREQSWSGRLPSWTWIIQFLLLAPIPIILIGNLGLLAMSAMHMTGTDGSSVLAPLLSIGIVSILILLPIMPFIHRVTHHIPLFLLLVFIATFIYNMAAFPFSVDNRFKFYFIESVDLDQGTNIVSLVGIEEFVRPVLASLPAASGQDINCTTDKGYALASCSYNASTLPPHLVNQGRLEDLLRVAMPKKLDGSTVNILIDALDTKTCTVKTSQPVFDIGVDGGSPRDTRYGSVPNDGFTSFQLWRRSWDQPWNVTINLAGTSESLSSDEAVLGIKGAADTMDELKSRAVVTKKSLELEVTCSYSDVNDPTTVPAFHELRRYMPPWSTVTKRRVGLVEVKRTYKIDA